MVVQPCRRVQLALRLAIDHAPCKHDVTTVQLVCSGSLGIENQGGHEGSIEIETWKLRRSDKHYESDTAWRAMPFIA